MGGRWGWGLLGMLACSATASVPPEPPGPPPAAAVSTPPPGAFDPVTCTTPGATATTTQAGDPQVRDAAQKGLSFLEESAGRWATGHECFGCHVHAVTVEALSVGTHHGYDVNRGTLATFVAAMTTGPGGSQSAIGLSYAHPGTLIAASHGFGGSAFARYDALVGNTVRDDLLKTAKELTQWQAEDGGLVDPESWTNLPVGTGKLQLTAQAVSTWRQAYEASADEVWLAHVARAEVWLKGELDRLDPKGADLQHLDYALQGLVDAGGSVSEAAVSRLVSAIGERQNADGGYSTSAGGPSDALATGQVLYTLRKLGLTDNAPSVARGTQWLVKNQQPAGGWRSGGFEKAEAMWAVLGLVSVDVLTLTVDGLTDGQHVRGAIPVHALATSNRGRGVRHVELRVDDRRWVGACGGDLATTWDTSSLASGRHLVEVTAVDGDGKLARRRIEVFTGDHFVTQLGSRWSDDGTLVTLRNVAPEGTPGTLRLQILKDGVVVHTESVPARAGANTFWYGAKDTLTARLVAKVTFVAPDGREVQGDETTFVHADPTHTQARYGEVAGQVQLAGGLGSANTAVELVDDLGNVLQRVDTSGEGNYRFKNVDAAKYKVRVVKGGYTADEIEVAAKVGEAAPAPPITTTEK